MIVTGCGTQLYGDDLVSAPALIILGGFLCSIVFFFMLLAVGNAVESLGQRSGWSMVLVCLTISTGHAATIHRDCAISGLFFSLVWLYYTYSYAQRQYH